MRTLKKSLALVLALVMVLGLGVVGASADNALDDYKDLDKLDAQYVEAAGVMTGLGIINGIDAVTLDPDGTYTREQAAKIIAYMVLGADNAEAMTCTVAPFDDVPASHWSAKYINFCVNEGIIDGMSEDTFAPFDTLTGFQWAKMLLSAVGFNAKKELTGADWAIKTQSIASQTGLFNGDLKGGDHVALRREQAILYAFNTLTGIGCVTWSESLGDYFYTYTGVGSRFTYQGTLAANVWKLAPVEGVIHDNEGMGAKTTILKNVAGITNPNYEVSVKADTGLDMMYHAVRIWFYTTNDTAVYTHDLATTTVYDCDVAGANKAWGKIDATKQDRTDHIGEGEEYVTVIVDNTAYDETNGAVDYNLVHYDVYTATMGRTDKTAGTTNINNISYMNQPNVHNTLKTANIKTDISGIEVGDPVIFLKEASHGEANAVGYIWPVTSTTGNVVDLDNKTGAITLSDGTVLEQSALFDNTTTLNALETLLLEDEHVTPAYVFTLDTHGHYMDLSSDSLVAVAYYTGAVRNTNEYGAWHGEELYAAQFVNLEDGSGFEVPVTADWAEEKDGEDQGYYDITSSLYGDTTYSPVWLNSDDNAIGDKYVYLVGNNKEFLDLTFNGDEYSISNVYKVGTVGMNPDTVNFVVSSGKGSKLEFVRATGVDGLLDAFGEEYGMPFTSVNLTNAMAVVEKGALGNYYITTIFAFGDVQSLTGGYIYFTEDADNVLHTTDNYYWTTAAYLNGAEFPENVTIKSKTESDITSIDAGLYTYTIDADGMWTVEDVDPIAITTEDDFVPVDGSTYQVIDTANNITYLIPETVTVVDVTDAEDNDKMESLDDVLEYLKDPSVSRTVVCSFVPASAVDTNVTVSVMYVLAP